MCLQILNGMLKPFSKSGILDIFLNTMVMVRKTADTIDFVVIKNDDRVHFIEAKYF